jgi:Ni,Fe-hydrogenase I large subunit
MTRLAIDPITRIGGHLRIEVEVSSGVVTDAWSSGTMFRGMELILRGRDPRDAWLFAQRICGTCNGVHALASVRAVENALGVRIPKNARLVRNILAGSQYVQDHVTSFYHRHAFDWVDVVSATTANPEETSDLARSISDRAPAGAPYFRSARDRWTAFVESGQPQSFANAYWGNPAYELTPEANLMIAAHYLEALDWRRRMTQLQTFLAGKTPHPQTFLVGGMALVPPWGGPDRPVARVHPTQVGRSSPAALSERGLSDIGDLIAEAKAFVDGVYVPDVLEIARTYRDWMTIGKGIGSYLSYGDFPEGDSSESELLLPRGRIMNHDVARVESVDQAGVAETIAHAYYASDDDAALVHPWDGQTVPTYTGPAAPVTSLEGSAKYSWTKAPRYQDDPMEVGPLARMLVGYIGGQEPVRAKVARVIAKIGVGPDALMSTLGRTVARAIEAQVVVDRLDGWLQELTENLASGDLSLVDLSMWDPGAWPSEARGWSLGESPQGAVGHWLNIGDRRIDDYQLVDASTWNCSPRDGRGRRGALEEALVGTPVNDPDQPLEILRTVHSFDPCTACAVHAYDPDGGGSIDIRLVEGDAR